MVIGSDVQADAVHSKALPDLLRKMLAERQQVLVLYHRLAELQPFSEVEPVQAVLQPFCQVMLDYLALGHFEVYQSLEESCTDPERHERAQDLVERLYPRIAATTERAVEFNDRYDAELHPDDLAILDDDLSRLGEALAERIELEDRLLAGIAAARV